MPPSDQDLRRDKRVRFSIRAPLATGSSTEGLIDNVLTIDLSGSGLRVRLSGQISPGQIVDVFLSKRPERCRVVWISSGGPHRDLIVGLEFISPLPGSQPSPSSDLRPTI